jgi:hypothetical protein
MLIDKINNRESGIVVYGITPPKMGNSAEKLTDIAQTQINRLKGQNIDGLILYDIQDEAERTDQTRPFPFIETLNGYQYSETYLKDLAIPKIVYRSSGKYTPSELETFLTEASPEDYLTVFVGAASSTSDSGHLSLKQAYDLKAQSNSSMLLGGVTIPERHQAKGDEQQRVFQKMAQGCSFFVSQGVYDVNASKNFLSDYYYFGQENEQPLAPVLLTLTPCGSAKTLEFMKWLGISIPRWLENDLIHSQDILEKSIDFSEQSWLELKDFADEKNIPIGCNIESVAIRKVEVDASIELLNRIQKTL